MWDVLSAAAIVGSQEMDLSKRKSTSLLGRQFFNLRRKDKLLDSAGSSSWFGTCKSNAQ
jgi:hypothetical protein